MKPAFPSRMPPRKKIERHKQKQGPTREEVQMLLRQIIKDIEMTTEEFLAGKKGNQN